MFRSQGLFGSGNGVRKPKDSFGELRAGRGLSMLVQRGVATLEQDAQRAIPVQPAADIAEALAALKASTFWVSSLAVTRNQIGTVYTQPTLLAGTLTAFMSPTQPALDSDGRATAVLLLPSATLPPAFNGHGWTPPNCAVPPGKRTRMTFEWRLSAIVANQCNALTVYYFNDDGFQRTTFLADGQVNSPGPAYNDELSIQSFKRADGTLLTQIDFIMGATTDVTFYPSFNNGGLEYLGDGTTGIILGNLTIAEVTTTAAENLSDVGTCTLTNAAANAPYLETSRIPGDGWQPNGSQAFRLLGHVSKTLTISAPGYQAVSGNSKPLTLTWLWDPYQSVAVDGIILGLSGATAALYVEVTPADRIRITRTTDAAITTIVTFDAVFGMNPAVYQIVLDGTKAHLIRQGKLVESKTFSLSGATTFTGGYLFGPMKARVAEVDLDARAWSVDLCQKTATYLANRRGGRTDRIPLFVKVGQSNAAENADGRLLAQWGVGGQRKPARFYITTPAYGNTSNNLGWGPARSVAHQYWVDATTPFFYDNNPNISASGQVGSESGFLERFNYAALANFWVGGASITTFLPAGANHAAMLAAYDAAVGSIGLDFYFAGTIIEGGETDAQNFATAEAFGRNCLALHEFLAARYSQPENPVPILLCYRLHQKFLVAGGYNYADLVRGSLDALAAENQLVGLARVDDFPMYSDDMHLFLGTTQLELGYRFEQAAGRLGR